MHRISSPSSEYGATVPSVTVMNIEIMVLHVG